jgi:DNA invertase Pin-like site-specific DNA recombinase
MSTRRRMGISYTRFSAPIQSKGDSQNRQDDLFRDFCQRHNLTPLSEIFADRGRSGYKDEHRKKGRLGQLIAMAKDGRFEPGTVIVVEAWDRLGRLRPDKQTELVAELLRTGVNIGVCKLDDIFTEDDFGTHKWTTLAVFIQLAYQESKLKADRVADSWKRRRERAREQGQLVTGQLPAWLEKSGDGVRLVPQRAATVRRIFELAAAGYGHTRIVQTLDKEKISAFGEKVINEGRSRSQFSGVWTRPYIRLVLNDRRALGEAQFYKIDGTPDGPPMRNYYPAVVSEDEFLLARAGQEARDNWKDGRSVGPRQGKYVNVFRSLLRHARDSEGFHLHNKGTRSKPELLLVSARGINGRGKCYTFPYPIFEDAILDWLEELDPHDILPREKEVPTKADVLRARLANLRQDIERLKDDLKQGYSKALAAVLRDQEDAEEKAALELQEELSRTVKPAAQAWKELPELVGMMKAAKKLPGVVEMIKESPDPDDVRLRVRPVLRRLAEEAWVLIVRRGSYQLCVVQFFFWGGARREFAVLYQPKANRRPGYWRPVSEWHKPGPKNLDLRRREHVKLMETFLEAFFASVDLKVGQ